MRNRIFLYSSSESPNYTAPELINCKFYKCCSIDRKSYGIILFTLLTITLSFDERQSLNSQKYKFSQFSYFLIQ